MWKILKEILVALKNLYPTSLNKHKTQITLDAIFLATKQAKAHAWFEVYIYIERPT